MPDTPLAGTGSFDRLSAFAALAERHPRATFIVAQVAVWGAFYLVQYLALLPRLEPQERVPFLLLELTMFVAGPTVTALLHLWYGWLRRWSVPGGIAGHLLLVLLAIWAGSHLWIFIDARIIGAILALTSVRFDWGRVSEIMRGSYWLTLLAWTGGYFAVRFWRDLQVRERAVLEFQLQARDAQLRALAYQLNPHFLFNTLNSVRALVLENPDRAREMITRLATFLRHTLNVSEPAVSTVAEEIESLKSYIAIEEARFEERLSVTWDLAADATQRMVPSLLLQPLVENAIRHGGDADGTLRIHIAAHIDGRDLVVTVANSGALTHDGTKSGVGLDNVRARLAHAYPGRHDLSISEANGSVIVVLRLKASAP